LQVVYCLKCMHVKNMERDFVTEEITCG
jgi:hypothetical protein